MKLIERKKMKGRKKERDFESPYLLLESETKNEATL